tara:strand:- start:12 stop:506 length:495 start_codon:yes stop_codon:yes gene_type:complete
MEIWNTFTKRILIDKPLGTVYKCWSTKSKSEVWFLEKADFYLCKEVRSPNESAQKGDTFIWKWNNWDFIEKGVILAANNKDSISFTFGSGGNVHVKLKTVGNATQVTLTQDEIPTDDESKMKVFVGCITDWTFWMANLKAYLEHGITLHVKGLNQNETNDLVNS